MASQHHSHLGASLVPTGGDNACNIAPHHLTRRHSAHISSDPCTSTSTIPAAEAGARQAPDYSGTAHWVTSYTSHTSGQPLDKRRPQGKRIVHAAAGQALPRGFGGHLFPPSMSQTHHADLQLGTTKASQHIPGYTGHISKGAQVQAAPARDLDKSKPLLLDNYKPFPGYTGRLK